MSDREFTRRVGENAGAMPKSAVVSGGRVQPPRIIHIDDQAWVGEMVELLIQPVLREAMLLRFEKRDTAWEELRRADPDLLITDLNGCGDGGEMDGWELLALLAQWEMKYPILVVSGCFSVPGLEARARQFAGPKVNASFMTKPFTVEFFQQEVLRLLNSGSKAGRRFPTDWL